jgi:hypothetical protein
MTANYYPDLSEWRSVSERADELQISINRYALSSLGLRVLAVWRNKNLSDPPRRKTNRSAGKDVSVYPPSFFGVIDEMIDQEKSVQAVSGRKWSLFEDEKSASKTDRHYGFKNAGGRMTKLSKMDARNRLIIAMADQFGLTDFQIAHTYITDRTGRSFIAPGLKSAPEGLAAAASEYIKNYRGSDPGPLIRRVSVKASVDKNQPMDQKDIGKIRKEWEQVLEAKKKIDEELLAKSKGGDGFDVEKYRAPTVSVSQVSNTASENTETSSRRDTSEPLSSISVPRSLLYRLRRMSIEASERAGRHVPPYELVARALDAIDCFGMYSKSSPKESPEDTSNV